MSGQECLTYSLSIAQLPFERHLKDLVWGLVCQVSRWLVCSGMSPDYAASMLCKFYHNSRFSLAPLILPLYDFSPICFAGFVKERIHPARVLFTFGRMLFLAYKAGCKLDVLEGGFVPFSVGLGGSLIDVAT